MKLLFVIISLISFQSIGQTKEYVQLLNSTYDDVTPTITIVHAAEVLNQENTFFLDTREVKEFDVSHIENSLNVGYDNFNISSVSHIKKDAMIIVYCSIGARSQTIAQKLILAGYTDVQNLYGGLFHWANNDYPMVDDSFKSTAMIHTYSKEWSKWIKIKGTIVY